MADPAIVFHCHECTRSDTLPLDTLQMIGSEPWFNADGWHVKRTLPYRVLCAVCWMAHPLTSPDAVETVRVRPKETG